MIWQQPRVFSLTTIIQLLLFEVTDSCLQLFKKISINYFYVPILIVQLCWCKILVILPFFY